MLDFQSYQTLLTRLQLQTRMNDREIQQYRVEKSASDEKISRLNLKTSELQEKLAEALKKRAHKEVYSKFAEELNRPQKFEVEKLRLEYDENEGKKKVVEQTVTAALSEDGKVDEMDVDSPIVSTTPTGPAASTPTGPASTAVSKASTTVTKLGLLNLSREDAVAQNALLVDEIAELEARKEMYEQTWNQRKAHFQDILESLQRFRYQVLEEKMEQERQEGMDEDGGTGGAPETSRAGSAHEGKCGYQRILSTPCG